jgi:hypothetical protein
MGYVRIVAGAQQERSNIEIDNHVSKIIQQKMISSLLPRLRNEMQERKGDQQRQTSKEIKGEKKRSPIRYQSSRPGNATRPPPGGLASRECATIEEGTGQRLAI